jgi:hypothetical protein
VFTGLLVGCTLVGAVISIWQATISQTAANAAKDAAETAHQALIETRTGSGVQDTHTLARKRSLRPFKPLISPKLRAHRPLKCGTV